MDEFEGLRITCENTRVIRGEYQCDDGHEEVFYFGDECPVCKEMVRADKLQDKIDELKLRESERTI